MAKKEIEVIENKVAEVQDITDETVVPEVEDAAKAETKVESVLPQNEVEPERVTFYCKEYPNLSVVVSCQGVDTINGKKVFYPGKEVRFENSELTTDDVDAIKVIREHMWYGLKIIEQGVDHSAIQIG